MRRKGGEYLIGRQELEGLEQIFGSFADHSHRDARALCLGLAFSDYFFQSFAGQIL